MIPLGKSLKERLDQAVLERFVDRMVVHLRQVFPERLPVSDHSLRDSVVGWTEDAKQAGLTLEESIVKYLEFCARVHGERDTLDNRLTRYLTVHHALLVSGLDLPTFVRNTVSLAQQNGVLQEEGITWLALIRLAGKRRPDFSEEWLLAILGESQLSEQARLQKAHDGAVARGLISSGGG